MILTQPEQDLDTSRQGSGSDCSRGLTPVRLHVLTKQGYTPETRCK